MRFAPLAVLFVFEFSFHALLVLVRPIVDAFALAAH